MTICRFLVVPGDSNPEDDFHNRQDSKDLQKPSVVNSVNTQHLLGSDCHGLTSGDPQLDRLISLWPGLQGHQKLTIIAIASTNSRAKLILPKS